jgi:hypothetical protein
VHHHACIHEILQPLLPTSTSTSTRIPAAVLVPPPPEEQHIASLGREVDLARQRAWPCAGTRDSAAEAEGEGVVLQGERAAFVVDVEGYGEGRRRGAAPARLGG